MATPQNIIELVSSDDESIDLYASFDAPPSHPKPGSEGIEATHFNDTSIHESSSDARFDPFSACKNEVLKIFPEIALDHVRSIYDKCVQAAGPYLANDNPIAQAVIEDILDVGTYPKEKERAKERVKELKRKRADRNSDDEEAAVWKTADLGDDPLLYSEAAKTGLFEAFDMVPIKYIKEKLKEHKHYYGAYIDIAEAQRRYDSFDPPPYIKLKSRRVNTGQSSIHLMGSMKGGENLQRLRKEIDAACQRRKKDDVKHQIEVDAALAIDLKEQEHRRKGEIMECGCCFDDYTVHRITHCDGDTPHFFCHDCAQKNAKNDIGNSRYELRCMDGSGCRSTFSREQRAKFLDEKTIEKLECLQQQDEIRRANLQNLVACPFCDFVAECLPTEIDREFRCHNPECEEVSCRLCKAKTHVPLSCEEFKRNNGVSERRIIEEARTEALVRTCGKCQCRIIKDDGCNKVTCTACFSVLCDYCGKNITEADYGHFEGQTRMPPGKKSGDSKCPLYDLSRRRKDEQIEQAGKEAMERVRKENPELTEEDLKIKFAKSVEASSNAHRHHNPGHAGRIRHHHHGIDLPALAHQPIAPIPELMRPFEIPNPWEMPYGAFSGGHVQQPQHEHQQALARVRQAEQQMHQHNLTRDIEQRMRAEQQQHREQMMRDTQQRMQAEQQQLQRQLRDLQQRKQAEAAAKRAAAEGETWNQYLLSLNRRGVEDRGNTGLRQADRAAVNAAKIPNNRVSRWDLPQNRPPLGARLRDLENGNLIDLDPPQEILPQQHARGPVVDRGAVNRANSAIYPKAALTYLVPEDPNFEVENMAPQPAPNPWLPNATTNDPLGPDYFDCDDLAQNVNGWGNPWV